MTPVACSDLTPGCSICSWDPVSIHSKSGTSPLGRCEENNHIPWKHEEPLADLCQMQKHNPGWILWCRLGWAATYCRHSISRYSFHMGMGAITWSSKKQYIVMLSSTEAEYIAQTHAAKEVMYLCTFVQEICGLDKPITINCDNQGAITLSKDNKFHAWTKHIDIQYHFIWEAVEDRKITLKYIPTDKNPVDIFTKLLTKTKFCHFTELLGLKDVDASW